MKAARIHRYGEPSEVVIDEIPIPEPGPGEVLVRVAATSFNPSEVGFRRGFMPVEFPHTLGWDVAGTIAGLGREVSGFTAGDQVIALAHGAAAEFVTVPADVLARAPRSIPLAQAAAIPVAGLTAWQAVFEHAKVQPGHRVLITGAGGGVGMFAVQLAKHAGATVIVATRGPERGGGVVGYDRLPGGNDVVLNLAPIEPPLLGDTVVTITLPADGATHFVARNDPSQLAELVALIDAGAIQVRVAETHPLTALPEIHQRAESDQIHGKIVIKGLK